MGFYLPTVFFVYCQMCGLNMRSKCAMLCNESISMKTSCILYCAWAICGALFHVDLCVQSAYILNTLFVVWMTIFILYCVSSTCTLYVHARTSKCANALLHTRVSTISGVPFVLPATFSYIRFQIMMGFRLISLAVVFGSNMFVYSALWFIRTSFYIYPSLFPKNRLFSP